MQNEGARMETTRCRIGPVEETDRNDVFTLYRSEDVRQYLGGVAEEQSIVYRFEQMLDSSKERKLGCRPQPLAETQTQNLSHCRLLERLGMTPLRTLTRFGEKQIIYRRLL